MKIFGKRSGFFLAICLLLARLPIFTAEAAAVDIDPANVFDSVGELTVYVDGEVSNALSGTYPWGEIVTLKAPGVAGKTFRYWTDAQGTPVSYSRSLTVKMYANTLLDAVYGDTAETAGPVAAFLSVTRDSDQIMFNAIATVPDGSGIMEAGVRYSLTKDTLDALKGDEDVTVEPATGSGAYANWILAVTPTIIDQVVAEDETYYVIAYVETADGTYYSDVAAVKLSELDYGMSAISYLNIEKPALGGQLCAVTFVANGGEGAMAPQGMVIGKETALNANTFTCKGYAFSGWSTTPTGSVTYTDAQSVTLTANLTLYAQWKEPLAEVKTAPEANQLIYDGSAQELVTAGEATGGTIQYALGTDATTAPTTGYTTSIPTATDAGTYYVWYKAVGDSTHTDTDPVRITVTIANKSSTPYVPYVPGNPAPAPATEVYTVPVANINTVDISVNISEGNAVVQEITQADLDKITGDTSGSESEGEKKTDDDTISIDVSGAKSEVISVELSGTSVEKLVKTVEENERVDSVEIKLTNATVELDSAAVSAISEQKEGDTVKLVVENTEQAKLNDTQKEALKKYNFVQPFQAYFESAGKEIHDFKGGKATVSIKFTPETGKDVKHYHVYYVPASGLIERYVTRYLDGMLIFVTSHFSDYAIVYDETIENETGKEDVTPSPSPSASAEPSVTPSTSAEPSAVPGTVSSGRL